MLHTYHTVYAMFTWSHTNCLKISECNSASIHGSIRVLYSDWKRVEKRVVTPFLYDTVCTKDEHCLSNGQSKKGNFRRR